MNAPESENRGVSAPAPALQLFVLDRPDSSDHQATEFVSTHIEPLQKQSGCEDTVTEITNDQVDALILSLLHSSLYHPSLHFLLHLLNH